MAPQRRRTQTMSQQLPKQPDLSNFPQRPSQVPQRGTPFSRACFKQLYLRQGWRFEGELPDLPKAVAIMAPHTSNYDAWYGFLAMLGIGIQLTILGKASLFNSPLRALFKWAGVIPVHRDSANGLTQDIINTIQQYDKIWLGIAPEGTRKQAEKIKSGFYHIAHGAGLPIVVFAFDYAQKTIRCLDVLHTSGDYEQDLAKIMDLYQGNLSPKNAHWLSKPLQKLVKKG